MMKILPLRSPDEFRPALAEHPCVIADFYKDHCPACQMLDLALARFKTTAASDIVLLKLKLEVLGEVFFRDLSLRQTPTLIFYHEGNEVCRRMGFQSPQQLSAAASSAFGRVIDVV